jgi:membrane protein DedA with SNARE-associated domain
MDVPAIIEHSPYLGLFALLVLGGLGLPFPEDATLIACGFLIAADVVRPFPALIVVYAGIVVTDWGLYAVGKKYGRLVVNHRRFRRILSAGRLSALEEMFKKRGVLFILVGRHLIGLRAQILIAAGVMRMNFMKFLVADAVSSMFTVSLMVGAGFVGGNSLEIIRNDITRIEHLLVVLAVVSVAVFLLFRHLRMRKNGRK